MTDWRSCTVDDLVNEKLIAPPMDGNHGEIHPKGDDFTVSGIPFVMASDIHDGVIEFGECKYISKEQADGLRKGFSLEGDVLLSHKATIGRTAIVPRSDFPYLMLTPQVTYYRVLDEKALDNRFLKYYFDSDSFQKTLGLWAGAGSTRAYLGITGQKYLPLRIPAIETQTQIADVLSAIDKKIELNNKINAELEAIAKLIYDYWFVQFDFPDANGKPYKSSGGKMVYNETLKREIPEGWEAKPLSKITPVSNQSVNPADTPDQVFRHYSIPVYDASKTYGLEAGGKIGSNKFTVEVSDILVSKLNPWFSRVIYAMEEEDIICSTEFVVWRTPNDSIKNFLYMVATSPQFVSHCTKSATGTSNSHKRVNPGVMTRFEIPFKEEIASALGERLEPVIKQIVVNQRENTQLAKLRDWLLPMLMNGQVTVKASYGGGGGS